ncbi:outer membrane beta-barrel protein [Mangrovibacterium lignilyticum]|uniref:outer membrane beta-barrel protein n=1 Tax=Mangrovibacterium lignilyticum TaxID=2668052 RepID=UPI0013D51962|nr:outer membrane beta-barrel protein [Mangrovibacterium lignilyticum]
MKKVICFLFAALMAIQVMSQDNERKGYLGTMLGPSFPYDGYSSSGNFYDGYAQTGININLLTFGYKIWHNIGITASWSGIANPIDHSGSDGTSAVGNLMVGPMYAFQLSEKFELDLRAMVGYTYMRRKLNSYDKGSASDLSWAVGAMLHYNLGKKWQLLLNLENYQTQPDIQFDKDPRVRLINLSFGVAYRLK